MLQAGQSLKSDAAGRVYRPTIHSPDTPPKAPLATPPRFQAIPVSRFAPSAGLFQKAPLLPAGPPTQAPWHHNIADRSLLPFGRILPIPHTDPWQKVPGPIHTATPGGRA